jgi:predicted nucleotidyltransferase
MSKTELEILEERKVDLINDLAATAVVMDEVWRYHPDNPKKVDIVKEYKVLQQMQKDIEKEIQELGI